MKHLQQGFSLIELMVVVAIIAVLSAVAVPQYQNYLMRAKWSVNITQAEPLKLAIAECQAANGDDLSKCDTRDEIGLAALPKVQYADDIVTLSYTDASKTLSAVITGSAAAGSCKVSIDGKVGSDGQLLWTLNNVANGTTAACSRQRTGV